MRSAEILERINALPPQRVRLMEVCGTHTMAIARAGLKRLLPEGVELYSLRLHETATSFAEWFAEDNR